MIRFIVCGLIGLSTPAWAIGKKPVCAKVSFSNSMTCEKSEIYFDISKCDSDAYSLLEATKVYCEKNELIANLKHKSTTYTAVFVKSKDGNWKQKGEVTEGGRTKTIPTLSKMTPEVTQPILQAEKEKAEEVKVDQIKPDMPWKFDFAGWITFEQETIENFGDAVTNNFTKSDPFNSQTDTNILANLQFTVEKDQLKFDSVFEVGEVFYGDSSTGGNQGTRGTIVEVRNFSVEEKYEKNVSFKIGLWTINADPRGFILSDHHAAAELKHETENSANQLWVANANDGKPGTVAVKDIYVGFNHFNKVSDKTTANIFLTRRSTRETFTDTDLVTAVTGESTYTWVGLNTNHQEIFNKINAEFNLIFNRAQFKAEAGGSSDNNSSWLAHAHADHNLAESFDITFDVLGTSGSSDARGGGALQVVGKRKNFASPNPSATYLLTLATSDGGDDAAGSVRTTAENQVARLDLDEGLRLAVVSLNKGLSEKWEGLVRFGKIRSAYDSSVTNSSDYGSEVDLKLTYKVSQHTSWIFEAGFFNPGAYFVNQDMAKLTTLKYKIDF